MSYTREIYEAAFYVVIAVSFWRMVYHDPDTGPCWQRVAMCATWPVTLIVAVGCFLRFQVYNKENP